MFFPELCQLHQKFLYYLIYMKRFYDYVESIKTNAAIPHITETDIADFGNPEKILPSLDDGGTISEIPIKDLEKT